MAFLTWQIQLFLRAHKKKLILFAAIFLLAKWVVNHHYATSEDRLIDDLHQQRIKVVQILTPTSHWSQLEYTGELPFRKCPFQRCFAFRSFVEGKALTKSDAVLVHVPDLRGISWWRPGYKRDTRQLWLFNSDESAASSLIQFRHSITELDDWFNLTVTYKPDSDIKIDLRLLTNWKYLPFYQDYMNAYKHWFYRPPTATESALSLRAVAFHKLKPSLSKVVYFVNDCKKVSKKTLNFISKLMRHIEIDVIGDCQQIRTARPDPCFQQDTCLVQLFKPYKFLLAFEDSSCRGFVGEQFWRLYRPELLFSASLVPVVRGVSEAEYERLAFDRSSFIHADSFDSPFSLARYLSYLIENRTAFVEHLAWKLHLYDRFEFRLRETRREKTSGENFGVGRSNVNSGVGYETFCLVCARLHDERFLGSGKSGVEISKWFNPKLECSDR